jgi:hypothetical protein
MKSFTKALLYGVCVWAVTFIAAMLIFPLRELERPLFESIMPVILSLFTVLFSFIYFKHVDIDFFKEGIYLGITWFLVNFIIDQFMFSWGPMQMSFSDYVKDIGVTYLLIPIITIGIGLAEESIFKKIFKTESKAN